jgi:hypothetical protein
VALLQLGQSIEDSQYFDKIGASSTEKSIACLKEMGDGRDRIQAMVALLMQYLLIEQQLRSIPMMPRHRVIEAVF